MLTPSHFGLPSKFQSWRSDQLESIDQILESPSRFIAVCAPTGFGKSLAVMAAAKMSGLRACIVTSTKGLQDQYQRDFNEISSDIRGQTNYRCPIAGKLGLPAYTTVADAPCKGGMECILKSSSGCEYYDKYRAAQSSSIVVTNYACWLYDSIRQDKLDAKRPFDMLVLDEAHDAPEQLASFLAVEIQRRDCIGLGIEWMDPSKMDWGKWKDWGRKWAGIVNDQSRDGADYKRRALCKRMANKLMVVGGMRDPNSWIWEAKGAHGEINPKNPNSVHFDPLWVQPYAETALFRNVAKIILVSATVRPKTAELLGITPITRPSFGISSGASPKDPSLDFREYKSNFPATSRPVIHVPTVQVNYQTEQDDMKCRMWLNRIDQLLGDRADRKGIIHTVSYKRARLIYENSQFSSRMLIHGSDNARQVIENFKRSSEPCVLISPSVSTGYDFPYEECEFQLIVKLPYPSTQDLVIKARTKQDKEYASYITMQQLVQSVGRGMRAEDDRCETLIVDDNIQWFMRQFGVKFAPKWFREAYRVAGNGLPHPLEKLEARRVSRK